jgi:hypothetical protein
MNRNENNPHRHDRDRILLDLFGCGLDKAKEIIGQVEKID